MLSLVRMAWRNIFRYRNRTAITVVAIAISVFVAILVDAVIMGIMTQSNLNMVNYEASEVVVYPDGYFEEKDKFPSDIVMDSNTREMVENALDSKGIIYAPRYRTTAELVFYDEDKDFEGVLETVLYGIDPQKDTRVFLLKDALESGEWVEEGDDSIVVGSTIASKMGLEVGDFVSLQCEGMGGFAQSFDVMVKGIVNTEDSEVNSTMLYMALDQLDAYLELEGGVNHYAVSDGIMSSLADDGFTSNVKNALKGIDGIEVHGFEEDNEGYMAIVNGDVGSSYMILFFLFIIAGAGIVNTMVMSVMERRKESAMMRSMGFSSISIKVLFVVEGFFIGCIGSAIGLVLACAVNYPLARIGLDFTGFVGGDLDIGYRISFVFHSVWSVHSFVAIPLIGIALTVLASYLPVSKIGRGQISDMLRKA